MSATETPQALSAGMPYRAIPARVCSELRRFSDRTTESTADFNSPRFGFIGRSKR
jgi:hypothetical protein